eukprot:TRINITY_DN10853_c0_g1_i2.p1 TRINITY_DN10853_c0_g1~~TRINITY_DN10853_c0_g1_i2.p1  ORF type:complete len:279 (-),score=43.60 TRINITY_DN10853_c0_g1_i2:42-878(-)
MCIRDRNRDSYSYTEHKGRVVGKGNGISSRIFKSLEIYPMEHYEQNVGYIVYRTTLWGSRNDKLEIRDIRDIALIFVDGKYQGTLGREGLTYTNTTKDGLWIYIGGGSHVLDIVVVNMGRINYGSLIEDRKGITDSVHYGVNLFNWEVFTLPMESTDLKQLRWLNLADTKKGDFSSRESFDKQFVSPTFFKGKFRVEKQMDTFVKLSGFHQGSIFLNGFNLGRYWHVGPQQTLYIPFSLLKQGENELVIFELYYKEKNAQVELLDHHILNVTESVRIL